MIESDGRMPEVIEDPAEIQRQDRQQKARDRNCNPDLPNLSVGDVNLTHANFNTFKKANNIYILGVSDLQCDHCCFLEGMLNNVHTDLQTKIYSFKVNCQCLFDFLCLE